MRPIRVVHLVWRLSVSGGIQQVVRNLAVTLGERDVELHVLSVRPDYPADRIAEVLGPDRFHSADHGIGRSKVMLPAVCARATSTLRALAPDVIHLHSGTAWLGLPAAISRPSARRVLEVHDAPQAGRSRRANNALSRLAARRLHFEVIVHSSHVKHQTADAFGLPQQDIRIVPLGVDPVMFAPDLDARALERERLGLEPGQPLVVWVGRLEAMKRPLEAVEVARRVRQVHPSCLFAMAGDGSLRDAVAASATGDPGIRVLGQVADLPPLLNAADVFVSTSSYEGFGLAAVEAMACGVPVVAARVGGLTDVIVDGQTGFLTPPDDLDAIARCVSRLLGSTTARSTMGAAARRRVEERFTTSRVADEYASLYRHLTDTR